MESYYFWADLLASYRLSPDWIKVLIVACPWAFLLGVIGLFLNYRLRLKRLAAADDAALGNLLPVVRQDRRWQALPDGRPERVELPGQVKPEWWE